MLLESGVDCEFANSVVSPAAAEVTIAAPGGRTWVVRLDDARSHADARAFCQDRGGDLLALMTPGDNQVLLSQLQQPYTTIWIGLKRPSAGSSWRWTLSDRPANYTNWRQGEPYSYPDTEELCADFSGDDGTWGAYFCDTLQPFACQFGE